MAIIFTGKDGKEYVMQMGGRGNGLIITGGAEGNPLPAELTSKEFWDKMDGIRAARKEILRGEKRLEDFL